MGDKKPYCFLGCYSSTSKLDLVLKVEENELLKKKKNRNNIEEFSLSYLEDMDDLSVYLHANAHIDFIVVDVFHVKSIEIVHDTFAIHDLSGDTIPLSHNN